MDISHNLLVVTILLYSNVCRLHVHFMNATPPTKKQGVFAYFAINTSILQYLAKFGKITVTGLNFKLDIGPLHVSLQVAFQRYRYLE